MSQKRNLTRHSNFCVSLIVTVAIAFDMRETRPTRWPFLQPGAESKKCRKKKKPTVASSSYSSPAWQLAFLARIRCDMMWWAWTANCDTNNNRRPDRSNTNDCGNCNCNWPTLTSDFSQIKLSSLRCTHSGLQITISCLQQPQPTEQQLETTPS